MINIAMMCPNPIDATSYYRAWGPFNALRKQYRSSDINLVEFTTGEWPKLGNCDIAFLQRPFLKQHLEAAKACKDRSIPLWIDYDDDLMNVPKENPSYEPYKDAPKVIKQIVGYADIITASKKEILDSLGVEGEVIQNAVGEEWGKPDLSWEGRGNVVVWRGTESHRADLLDAKDEFLKAYEEMKVYGWKYVFMGWNPWFITEKMDKEDYHYEPQKSLFEFSKSMSLLRAKVFWFPLRDNKLNRAKSLNCWEDATHFGSLFVCPRWYMGAHNCSDDLMKTMILSMEQKEFCETAVSESQREVLYLKNINYKRNAIIQKIMEESSESSWR